jgi:hypothetical protein
MPITVSQMASNEATLQFEYLNQSVTLTYYPGRITEKALPGLNAIDNIQPADSEEVVVGKFQQYNAALCNLLKSWDVQEDDGSMFPLDPVRLSELDIAFRRRVLSEIMGDIRPNTGAAQN